MVKSSVVPVHEDVKIPTTIDEITPEWLSCILGTPISSENYQLTGNVQSGTGFLSSIFRISCLTTGETPQALHLIVKILPQGQTEFEQISKQLSVDQGWDIMEINVYKYILPDIVSVLPELEPYLCKFYTGFITENPRNSVLVLEDLKPQGYHGVTFAQELPQPLIEEIVQVLAKFHYAASALKHKKGKPYHEIYPFLKKTADATALKNFILENYKGMDEFFSSQNCDQEFRDYFKQLEGKLPVILDRIYELIFKPETLIHGDLWTNNVMVNDDPNYASLKVFDWQLLAAGEPVWDIAVVILTFLPASKLDKENVIHLFKLYYDTHAEYCKKNGLDVLITRSYEEFLKDFLGLGMALAFGWLGGGIDPFASNLPRYVKIFEFLKNEIDVVPYLLTLPQ